MNRSILKHRIKKYRWLFLFLVPAVVFALLFSYLPMVGILVGFKDNLNLIRYSPLKAFAKADWTLEHFQRIFSSSEFLHILGNTLIISLMKIFLLFPMPIILAIMVTELTNRIFSKAVQSIVYLPHFLSWVVIAGIWISFLAKTGAVNQIRGLFGLTPIDYMTDKGSIRWVLFFSEGWRSLGWDSIIYFTTILGISPSLYEAADIDGATRFQMVRYIVLPALVTPMVTMFILNLGFFLNAGFDQVLNFTNAAVNSSIEILDTYIYSIGIGQGQYSLATAVGLVKGVFGVMLVLLTHVTSKRLTGTGVW